LLGFAHKSISRWGIDSCHVKPVGGSFCSAEWAADQFFADREALVAGAARDSAALVDDLKDAAGDRWPRPSSRRRR
jgi:hypothetical protein